MLGMNQMVKVGFTVLIITILGTKGLMFATGQISTGPPIPMTAEEAAALQQV